MHFREFCMLIDVGILCRDGEQGGRNGDGVPSSYLDGLYDTQRTRSCLSSSVGAEP